MKIEELISVIGFRVSGLNDLRAAEKAIASLKKTMADAAKSAQRNLSLNLSKDAQKLTKQLRDASAAARQAKSDFSALGGGRSWIQAELDRLRQLQRVQRQVGQEARRQQAQRARAPSARPAAELDSNAPRPPRRERRRRDRDGRMGLKQDPLQPNAPDKKSLPHISRGDARTGTRSAITASSNSARESFRQQQAGMSPDEIRTLRLRSLEISAQHPSVDATTVGEMGRSARNMLPSFDQAMEILPDLTKALVALQSAKGVETGKGELEDFLKSLDVGGRTENISDIRGLLQGAVKATAVEGRQLPLREYLLAQKYSKSAGVGLSPEFLTSIAPTFMQDIGGQRFGTQLGTMLSQLVGDRSTSASKDQQRNIGIRNQNGIVSSDLLLSNPYEWTNKVLRPALQAQGVDLSNEAQISKSLAKVFSAQMVSDLFTKFITQSPQVERNKKLYAGAMGLEASDVARQKDPYVALEGLYGSIRNLAGVATEGQIEKATGTLNSLADAIGGFTKRLAGDPEAANLTGSIGLGAGAAAVGGLAWLKWKMLKGVASLFGGKTPAVPVAEPAAPAGPASQSSAGAPKPTGAPGGGFLRGAGGLLRGGVLTALYEGGKLAIDAGLNALNRKIGVDPSKNKVDDSITGTLGRLSEDVKRGLAFLGNPVRGGGRGQSVIDDAVLERSRRAQEDYRRDPEGARGRAMSARDAARANYSPEQAQTLVSAIENFASGTWVDRITEGAKAAWSSASAQAAQAGGGAKSDGARDVHAPISITSSASFSGIMDAAAVAKIEGMIKKALGEAASTFSAKMTKSANTSTGNITGP